MSSTPTPVIDDHLNRACFDGTVLASVVFGALMMLYIQLIQVLWRRPKRGRVFGCIVLYSSLLFPLATLGFIGKIKFAESMFVTNRLLVAGAKAYYAAHSGLWSNVMSQASITLLPWIGDILMLHRLMVLWTSHRWILIFPGFLYLAHISMSVPLLISHTRPNDKVWSSQWPTYETVFYSLCVSLNLVSTILICVRIFMMRTKAEKVLGKLQASFYNSSITLFVESGALFTIWAIATLIGIRSDSWVQDIFVQPYSYIYAIARMFIIMRIAQDRAWSRDIIMAAIDGELDWQISSTSSMPLHNVNVAPLSGTRHILPQKIIDDSLSITSNR